VVPCLVSEHHDAIAFKAQISGVVPCLVSEHHDAIAYKTQKSGVVPYLVSEHHDAIIGLAPQYAAHALRRVPHRVEGQKVSFLDLELVPQVLEPRL
jgi:hypothetical protein